MENNYLISKKRRTEERRAINNNNNIGSRIGDGTVTVGVLLDELPEACIAKILSFTTPADVCRLSCVSPNFRSAAASDVVWGNFLPPIISHTINLSALAIASKKQLFFHICDNPILIDGKKISVSVDKHSGKITSYMIGPRDVHRGGDHWDFISHHESRFKEVAVVNGIYHLEIGGRIRIRSMAMAKLCSVVDTKKLCAAAAYLVYKAVEGSFLFGFHFEPADVSVAVVVVGGGGGHQICTTNNNNKWVYLCPHMEGWLPRGDWEVRELGFPKKRADGWLEAELGRFQYQTHDHLDLDLEEEEQVLDISFKDTDTRYCKNGLMVQGIEIRPIT